MSLTELSYLLKRIQGDLTLALEQLEKLEGPQTVSDLVARHPLWLFTDPWFKELGGWERTGIVAQLPPSKNPFGSGMLMSQGPDAVSDFDKMLTNVEVNLGINRPMTAEVPADE